MAETFVYWMKIIFISFLKKRFTFNRIVNGVMLRREVLIYLKDFKGGKHLL